MTFLTIVTVGFLLLEASNVVALYFASDFKYANAIGVFKAWEKSKSDPEMHDFVKYLVNWVAGTKLIFILLLIVILIFADGHTLVFSGFAMALSIASFFFRLFPLIRKMDTENQIQPKGYSLTLGWMIGAFVLIFLLAAVVAFL